MRQKLFMRIGIVILGTLVLGGVVWCSEYFYRAVQTNVTDHNTSQGQTQNPHKLKTLQDLVNQSESITLPTVDISKWDGHYNNETLGIEFRYPKSAGWEIIDDRYSVIYKDTVCLGNKKYSNVLIEGESDCIVQISKALFKDESVPANIEDRIVNELITYHKDKLKQTILSNFPEKSVIIDNAASGTYFTELYFKNKENQLLEVSVTSVGNNVALQNVYFGILQTLKSRSE